MNRFFATMLAVVFLGTVVAPRETTEDHRRIIRFIEQRDRENAIVELEKLRAANAKLFISNNYDYLLARTAEAEVHLGTAMANYQAVARRETDLRPYALAHMSQIARSTGNLLLERIYLNEILVLEPDSIMAGSVKDRLARNAFETGNYGETVRILTGAGANGNAPKKQNVTRERDSQALIGEAYLGLGNVDRARRIFKLLLDNMPNAAQPDDAALTAARGLDALDGGSENIGKKAPDLTEIEHLRRANIYQFNRDFGSAKLHFEAIVGRFTGGVNAPDAIFEIGRGFAQTGDFAEAIKWYERLLEQYPESPAAKDALLQAAAAYARVGKAKEATTRYQAFIDRYPTDEKLDRAYLNTVDVLRDQGEDQDALKWCEKARQAFAGRAPEALAVFAAARIHIAREDWQNALTQLDLLRDLRDLGTASPGGTTAAEAAFLRAFTLEKLKHYAEAIDAYLAIPDGREEYYGWRATERLKALVSDGNAASAVAAKAAELTAGMRSKVADTRRANAQSLLRLTEPSPVREKVLADLRSVIRSLPKYKGITNTKPSVDPRSKPSQTGNAAPHRSIADKLSFLLLYDEAAPEFEAAGVDTATLADIYRKGDRGDRSIAFVEPMWKKMPADYPIELIPRDHLQMLYPAPFADEIIRSSAERSFDPRLVLAIIRQESRFDPDARSNASARGLMQFIAPTSTRIAGELGIKSFSQDDLYFPPTAILFGSQYAADLFKAFPNQPDAVAASYNGGDDNVKRWLTRARSNEPDRYVAEIMFSQSKDYVFRVMANYRMYKFLYDEELRPK